MWLFPLLLLLPLPAMAAEPGFEESLLEPGRIFALLFLMVGPKKLFGPFIEMTRGRDFAFRLKFATKVSVLSFLALLCAGILGTGLLHKYNVPIAVLALGAGILLFLVALKEILEQFSPYEGTTAQGELAKARAARMAFPTIVTPWGIAATIVLCEMAGSDVRMLLVIAGITFLVLSIDWVAMIAAGVIVRWAQPALEILSVIFAVLQVAIGLQLIFRSLAAMGFEVPRE